MRGRNTVGSKLRPQRRVLAFECRDLPPRVRQLARQVREGGTEPFRTLGASERLRGTLYQRISTAV
jgi:hypothetical protein